MNEKPTDDGLPGPGAYRLVAVEWVDSIGCSSRWGEIDDVPPTAHRCVSVGWLARESDEAILLVPHISLENKAIDVPESGCGDMTIPNCSVQRIIDLTPNVMDGGRA